MLRALPILLPDSPENSGDGCIRQIPSWCTWAPFADWQSECAPYSDAELHQLSVCQMQKIAAVNPELAQQGIENADAAQRAMEEADPAGACQLNAAVNHPTLSWHAPAGSASSIALCAASA